ncbi:DUF2637 domain-containing protein [Streptomyces sp. NPDC059649]|uniref:DUF2637 domain-containing protein n=1 Tax=Streptomyces sp. NPDC059649 TaxID=3346895 RepID=UPI003673EF6C
MRDVLTPDQTPATGEAMAGATPDTAGATPDTAGATPPGHPATPAAPEAVPAARHKGGRGVATPATEGVLTAPAAAGVAGAKMADPPATAGRRVPPAVTRSLAVATVLGMVPVAAIGFASSYSTLRAAAVSKGFAPDLADWVPIGIDGAILAFIALDLFLVARRIPWPVMRFAAHAMTLATVVFNATGTGKSVAADPVRAGWHGLMPLLFIIGVEAARKLLVHAAQLATNTVTDRIPLHRWMLAPLPTARLYRRMRLAGVRSYPEMIEREQDLAGYRVWLTQQHGGDLSRATEIERLPMTMAPRGYTVAEALALPERWAAEQAERERQAAERKRLEAERRADEEKRARLRAIRDRGEIQQAEHQVEAETSAAQAQAEQTRAEADAAAEAARIRAEQTRLRAERTAKAEAEALESEDAAAARLRAAEKEEEAARAAHRAQEERRKAEQEKLEADRAVAARKAEKARTVAAERQIAEDEERKAAAELRAQEHRRAAAEAEEAAQAAEDLLRLTPRERRERRVARMIVAAGAVDAVPLADIETELNVARTTAGEIRQAAANLLQTGAYQP